MITRLATWWLRRRGFAIEKPQPIVRMLVSGHAVAVCKSDDGCEWDVSFPERPVITSLHDSLVDEWTPSQREEAAYHKVRGMIA